MFPCTKLVHLAVHSAGQIEDRIRRLLRSVTCLASVFECGCLCVCVCVCVCGCRKASLGTSKQAKQLATPVWEGVQWDESSFSSAFVSLHPGTRP